MRFTLLILIKFGLDEQISNRFFTIYTKDIVLKCCFPVLKFSSTCIKFSSKNPDFLSFKTRFKTHQNTRLVHVLPRDPLRGGMGSYVANLTPVF